MAGVKAFWVDVSRYLLASMKLRKHFLIMAVNSLPMQDVREIGLKLVGDDGSDVADGFPSSLMAANFHVDGTAEVAQQRLNMLCRATRREGQFLKITKHGSPLYIGMAKVLPIIDVLGYDEQNSSFSSPPYSDSTPITQKGSHISMQISWLRSTKI